MLVAFQFTIDAASQLPSQERKVAGSQPIKDQPRSWDRDHFTKRQGRIRLYQMWIQLDRTVALSCSI